MVLVVAQLMITSVSSVISARADFPLSNNRNYVSLNVYECSSLSIRVAVKYSSFGAIIDSYSLNRVSVNFLSYHRPSDNDEMFSRALKCCE